MAGIKNQMLRLRSETVDKLRAMLDVSPHRSMSSLADEILDKALDKMLAEKPEFDAAGALRGIRRDG
jgi:hypothetical protein